MEKWQNQETVAVWLLIVCGLIFLFAYSIFYLFRLRYKQIAETELDKIRSENYFRKELLEVQEKERVRFGSDLHDGLIGKLMAVQFKHHLPKYRVEVSKMLSDIIVDTRRISHDLNPPLIEYTPIDQLIENTLLSIEQHVPVDFERDVRAVAFVSDKWKVHLLRVIQEVVTNSLKHAGASELRLRLRITENYVQLIISDNGTGFSRFYSNDGLGMKTIALRTKEMNAAYKFKSRQLRGVSFILTYQQQT